VRVQHTSPTPNRDPLMSLCRVLKWEWCTELNPENTLLRPPNVLSDHAGYHGIQAIGGVGPTLAVILRVGCSPTSPRKI
jgi:hypothetical protein